MKFTEEQIEKMANEYAEEQNSAYTNDYYGFIAGFKKALNLLSVQNNIDKITKENLTTGYYFIEHNGIYREIFLELPAIDIYNMIVNFFDEPHIKINIDMLRKEVPKEWEGQVYRITH
jgi:hypothetical protein